MLPTQEQYSLFNALAPPQKNGGPINSLLFINNGTLLVSGGDDQIVRTWDIFAGIPTQELRDHRWGQITALSWLAYQANDVPVLFIGTGRGVVSAYPFSNKKNQFLQQHYTIDVFGLNDSVEVQALDPIRSRFAVASHSGYIRMFSIQDIKTLHPLWTFQVGDIPRGLFFQNDGNGPLTVHTCCLGDLIRCNSITGAVVGRAKLQGGVGSAALSADGRTMAVYNLSSGYFDVYLPSDSLFPLTLPGSNSTRFIKQCVFAEDNDRTLVCGGDNGTVHVFQLGEVPNIQSLRAEGPDTFYAVTAISTIDYHFIACGDSEEPATIFIWSKPTKRKVKDLQRTEFAVQDPPPEPQTKLEPALPIMQKIRNIATERRRAFREGCFLLFAGFFVVLSVVFPATVWLAHREA